MFYTTKKKSRLYMRIVHFIVWGENFKIFYLRVCNIQLCFSFSDDYIVKERMRYEYLGKLKKVKENIEKKNTLTEIENKLSKLCQFSNLYIFYMKFSGFPFLFFCNHFVILYNITILFFYMRTLKIVCTMFKQNDRAFNIFFFQILLLTLSFAVYFKCNYFNGKININKGLLQHNSIL